MAEPNSLNLHPPEFERFLYAPVGEDRNGNVVTVLSTLARLGLDPWRETTNLVALEQDVRRERLGQLLSVCREVPALRGDAGKVARELCLLLPEIPPARPLQRAASTIADGRLGSSGAIWTLLAIILVLFQVLFVGGSGTGSGE